MSCSRLLSFAVLFLAAGAFAQVRTVEKAAPSEYARIKPARLTLPSLRQVEASQFLGSDRKGRVFLLEGKTLEVFRLHAGAPADSVGKLVCRRDPEREPEGAYGAAMDPDGSTWAVADSMFAGPSLCDFQKSEQPTGFTGWLSSLSFSRSGLLAAVIPFGNGGMDVTGQAGRMPRVLELERDHWEAASWAAPSGLDPRKRNYVAQLKAESDSLICAGPKGQIWLAAWNLYRLQQVSSFEEPDREIVVGTGKVEWAGWTADEKAQIDADLKKKGIDPATNQIQSRPVSVVRALVCAPDGYLYLLVSKGETLALDRFDPAADSLERVLLEGVDIPGGPMTAALGGDGLVIGGRFTDGSLWRISPEDLATAPWKPVLGVRVKERSGS